jgi:hypothetical protein
MKTSTAVYLITAITLIALLGFFPTYFSKFPEFEGLKGVHHFHGVMMMSWFGMLIAQPVLIRYKRVDWHKMIGKASYLVAPLVAISIYLVMREEYYDDLSKYTRERSLAGLDLDLMSLFSFVILYSLAIGYKKRMDLHMRYMICTGLLIFVPGLARFLGLMIGLSNAATGISILTITYGLYAALVIYDYKKGKTVKPYLIGLLLVTLTNIVVASNKSEWWQWLAGNFADYTL